MYRYSSGVSGSVHAYFTRVIFAEDECGPIYAKYTSYALSDIHVATVIQIPFFFLNPEETFSTA